MTPFHRARHLARPLIVLAAVSAPLGADTLTYSDTHLISITNWSDKLTLPQFDPSLGTLQSVQITFDGNMAGEARVENLAPSRALVTTTLQVELRLIAPDASVLLALMPMVQNTANLSAFDGSADFGGTSGVTYLGLAASDSGMFVLVPTNGAAFDQFVGTGSISYTAEAIGSSIATGSANLISQFNSDAGATLTVVYTFEPAPSGTEGCSHGYWKNHLSAWGPTGLSPADDFDTVFGVDAFDPDRTLLEALQAGGGGINNLGRQGTAALLNALHPSVDFPLKPDEVIGLVQDAIANGTVSETATYLDDLVNLGCPLN